MEPNLIVRRDTPAWRAQVWGSFLAAVALCALGIWHMPSESLDRAFIAVGYFFCLSAAFTLAKMLRDNQHEPVDTAAWRLQVWVAFMIAISLTGWGLFRMNIGLWEKGYMVCAWVFLISSSFTLAKTLRDGYEADLIETARYGENGAKAPG
ncbi:YiaA/YiaB family inner membrane protein [Methylomagnum sp.]